MSYPIPIPADIEDVSQRFPIAGFYLTLREIAWVVLAATIEAALAALAVSAGFAWPTLVALAIPPICCFAVLQLPIEGAPLERWLIDVARFHFRGRMLCRDHSPQTQSARLQLPAVLYTIACPGRRLANGARTRGGYRFEISNH